MPGRDKFDLQSSATFSTDTLYYIGSTTENLQESGLLGDTYVSKMKEFGKGLSTASFFCFELLLALTRAALYKRSRSSISVKEEGDLLWPKFRAEQELQEKLGDIKCLFFPASEMGHVVGLSWLLGHKKGVGIDSIENVETCQTSGHRSDHPVCSDACCDKLPMQPAAKGMSTLSNNPTSFPADILSYLHTNLAKLCSAQTIPQREKEK